MSETAPLPPDRAAHYSPLSFLRERRDLLAEHVNEALAHDDSVMTAGSEARWYWRRLEWDSAHFGVPMIRLEGATWEPGLQRPATALAATLRDLRAALREAESSYYLFAEIPAEDPGPLQALGLGGFRLVETRLTYVLPDAAAFSWPERYPVRLATPADAPHVRDVASRSRNPYDRYHADPYFSDAVADGYLGTYAANAVDGLASMVVVPDPDDGEPPGAFFAISVRKPPACPVGLDHDCPLGLGMGRIILVAVSPERKGWHLRLLAETTRLLSERGVDVISMTTQAANRPAIRNCEKVGYRLGRVTHVMATSDEDTM